MLRVGVNVRLRANARANFFARIKVTSNSSVRLMIRFWLQLDFGLVL